MDLLEEVRGYEPVNEQECRDKEEMLRWLESGLDVLTRDNTVAHFTASAWVVSPDRQKVLLAYHNLYDSWAWLGGHSDGEEDQLAVARREVAEESGLESFRTVSQLPISLEILTVEGHEKRGAYVSGHLHLNVTYLFEADPKAPIRNKPDENSAVAWVNAAELNHICREAWFTSRIYPKLVAKSLLLRG